MISENIISIILNNIFYVVISLLLYQLFVIEKPLSRKEKKLIVFFLSAVVVVLCIITPIELGSEYHFDLRQIPMIIGFLYGGPTVGMGVYILLVTTRFLMGGIGAVGALLENTIILLLLFYIYKQYSTSLRKRKYGYIITLSVISFILSVLIFMILTGMNHFYQLSVIQLIIYIIQTGVLCLSVYFIEVMLWNRKIREKLYQAEKMEIVSHLAASVS
ncbi:MAG: histidine kinase, partial [Bacillus sp. (in: firmicutes)]|nr:histidine kinase [Bacillus sp. (in: firmicutes)]